MIGVIGAGNCVDDVHFRDKRGAKWTGPQERSMASHVALFPTCG
jgi:hypothetical protein